MQTTHKQPFLLNGEVLLSETEICSSVSFVCFQDPINDRKCWGLNLSPLSLGFESVSLSCAFLLAGGQQHSRGLFSHIILFHMYRKTGHTVDGINFQNKQTIRVNFVIILFVVCTITTDDGVFTNDVYSYM